jgi:hypothetical protein
MAGVFALALEKDPTLTPERFLKEMRQGQERGIGR